MKEIIYLDTEIMNSLTAQLEQGIINDYTKEHSSVSSESVSGESKTEEKSGFSASFKASTGAFPGGEIGFNGSLGSADSEGQGSSKGFTEGQKDLLNKKFHDYSLDLLIEKLEKGDLIKDHSSVEGDIIKTKGAFDFYDFSLISVATNPDLWSEVMSWEDNSSETNLSPSEAKRIYNKLNSGKNLTNKEETKQDEAIKIHENNMGIKEIVDIMKKLEVHSSTIDKLFKDLTFIKTNNLIGLLKKDYLRESTESLSFRGSNSRKATFLGRIIGVKNNVTDGSDMDNFSPHEINKIPNILLDILLGSFGIIKIGDTLISPIAIFYESN